MRYFRNRAQSYRRLMYHNNNDEKNIIAQYTYNKRYRGRSWARGDRWGTGCRFRGRFGERERERPMRRTDIRAGRLGAKTIDARTFPEMLSGTATEDPAATGNRVNVYDRHSGTCIPRYMK